jgi:hypothetical protein
MMLQYSEGTYWAMVTFIATMSILVLGGLIYSAVLVIIDVTK